MSSDTNDRSRLRNIVPTRARATPVEPAGAETDLIGWLTAQARAHGLDTLLAFADDGVIWGKVAEDLRTAPEVPGSPAPKLRPETLQTAHLFGAQAEVRLWRDAEGDWRAVLLHEVAADADAPWTAAFDEQQIVWGTDATPAADGFSVLRDGAQGLAHAVPRRVEGRFSEDKRPLRLKVRYYLGDDETTGFTRIVAVRLVKLLGPEDKEPGP
jgi:CRISPR-associated protein (TIGR03984 family)